MKKYKVISTFGNSFIQAEKIRINGLGQVEFFGEDGNLKAVAPIGALVRQLESNEVE